MMLQTKHIHNAIKEFENTTGIKHENVIKFETRISNRHGRIMYYSLG